MSEVVLSYDLGGTKLLAGVVDSKAKILEESRELVDVGQGKMGVITQMARMGKVFSTKYPQIKKAAVASAGPLDPNTGVLLDPTNLKTDGESWGELPLTELLSKELDLPVQLENDAAASILAEHWIGKAKGINNAMVLTLGTGLGVGTIINGELLRSGRNLHPEASHISLDINDKTAPCGCGNFGCVEAYISGKNFSRRAGKSMGMDDLKGHDLKKLAREGDPKALAAFSDYARLLAFSISSFVVLYAPEVVILAGGFSDTSDLFIDQVHPHLEKLLERRRVGIDLYPKLEVSDFKYETGLVGAAYVAFH